MIDVTPEPTFAALGIGYLLGSIPFGFLLTRLAGYGDIRAIGSGNIGATNVLRTGNKWLAALTLLLDGTKGAVAVALGLNLAEAPDLVTIPGLAGGLGAFLGHLFPVWLGFRGGKGVATYIGVLSAVSWPAGLLMCALWLSMALLTRYSSLSALMASGIIPFALLAMVDTEAALLFVIMTSLLVFKHWDNIRRLAKGEEPKIGIGTGEKIGEKK